MSNDEWFHWTIEVETENGLFRQRIRTNTPDLKLVTGEAESTVELAEDAMDSEAISVSVRPSGEDHS